MSNLTVTFKGQDARLVRYMARRTGASEDETAAALIRKGIEQIVVEASDQLRADAARQLSQMQDD